PAAPGRTRRRLDRPRSRALAQGGTPTEAHAAGAGRIERMTLPPRRIGIVGNREKKGARAMLPALVRWLKARDVKVALDRGIASAVRGVGPGFPLRSLVARSDAVLVLGGDGTFLAAAREAARADVPVLGVNLGGLGFLTETAESELYVALERLIAGDVEVEHRMMVEA